MRPMALAAAAAGAAVDGCDRYDALEPDQALDEAGIRVVEGHDPGHVDGRRLITTTAVRPDDPEIARARADGVLHHRSDLLNALLRRRASVSVTGTHGKGTVAALTGMALAALDADPQIILGVWVPALDGPFRAGSGPAVVEADDADGSIARIRPTVSVVTNSWADHPGFGRTRAEVADDIAAHVAGLDVTSRVIVGRGRNLAPIARAARAPVWRLGRDFDVETLRVTGEGHVLRLRDVEGAPVEAHVALHGGNLADNAALAFAALRALGWPAGAAAGALGALTSLRRRLELVADVNGIRIFDDIGKHPEAVAANLAAVRALRPHAVHVLYEPFVHEDVLRWAARWSAVLGSADSVVVLPVDDRPVLPPKRVAPADWPKRVGLAADLAGSRDEAVELLGSRCQPGDAVVVLGALDDLDDVPQDLASWLTQRNDRRPAAKRQAAGERSAASGPDADAGDGEEPE
jgi:UDP-N-acetylmuramate--alanine ligase